MEVRKLEFIKDKFEEISTLGEFTDYIVDGYVNIYEGKMLSMNVYLCFGDNVLHSLYRGSGWDIFWEYMKLSKESRAFLTDEFVVLQEDDIWKMFKKEIETLKGEQE